MKAGILVLNRGLARLQVRLRQDFESAYYTIYYTILYYTILYYTILYYTILYYTILYYTILYYTILYYMLCLELQRRKAVLHSMKPICEAMSCCGDRACAKAICLGFRIQLQYHIPHRYLKVMLVIVQVIGFRQMCSWRPSHASSRPPIQAA